MAIAFDIGPNLTGIIYVLIVLAGLRWIFSS